MLGDSASTSSAERAADTRTPWPQSSGLHSGPCCICTRSQREELRPAETWNTRSSWHHGQTISMIRRRVIAPYSDDHDRASFAA